MVRAAIRRRDTPSIFDWLMSELSLQGVSDRVAKDYIDDHGNITWADIDGELRSGPSCPKLRGYWQFNGCQYHKGTGTCAEPDHFDQCGLPTHMLRNGRLNQTAYSLYLFVRDIAGGDLVGWIDRQLGDSSKRVPRPPLAELRAALIDPLRNVYGVSDKILTMALSFLLVAAGKRRWFEVGASFIVVDTLVHNFLERTGILRRFEADHAVGPQCYQPGRCAEILERIANEIDASAFNPTFPPVFPRFVQIAVWQYCAEGGLDVCNGNRIDDKSRCDNRHCQIRGICDRVSLKAKIT
jgi:hypothetical protein